MLSTPPASAVREMNSRYGKVMRSIRAARSYFSGDCRNPGAKIRISTGAATTPTAVTRNTTPPRVPAALATRSGKSER